MNRRHFIAVLGGAAAWPVAASAQQAMPVIGYLHPGTPEGQRIPVAAFLNALNEAGYREGENVAIDYHWGQGQYDRTPTMLADVIGRKVAVIVAGGGTALAAKAAETSIPIVFTSGVDPVEQGLVPSLSRPGGHMTGVAFFANALGAKQVELVLEVVPTATLIGFVNYANYPFTASRIAELESAAGARGRKVVVQNIGSQTEIDAAFAALGQQGVGALIVSADPLFTEWREQLATLAARHHLPACYGLREFATAGGLMSYGSDLAEGYRQVGAYVARILKGEKPADLPVVRAAKVSLVLNLKAAKTLGIEMPASLLARADEVIE